MTFSFPLHLDSTQLTLVPTSASPLGTEAAQPSPGHASWWTLRDEHGQGQPQMVSCLLISEEWMQVKLG